MTSSGVKLEANVSRSGYQMFGLITGLSIQYLVIHFLDI